MRDLRWLLCGVACALSACTTILPTSEEGQAHSTVLLQQQAAQASARLRAGGMATPMLYAGFALNDQSSAFQGDVLRLSEITAQLSPNSPQLLFSNAQGAGKPALPFATIPDFVRGAEVLQTLASEAKAATRRDPLLVVLFSSHGGEKMLNLSSDDANGTLSAHTIAKVLEPLEAYPTLLIISACHSGSHVPDLQRDNRIILTAAAADRVSFGCQSNSRQTWFVEALLKSFDPELSLKQWFDRTVESVRTWEKNLGYKESLPQMVVGADMSAYATTPMRRLFDGGNQITRQ